MKNQEGTDDNPTLLALSALVDGESTDGQKDANDPAAEKLLLDTLQNNEMRAQWTSMHITRDVLRAEYSSALPGNFASVLRARIEREEPEPGADVSADTNVVGLDQHRARKSTLASKRQGKSAASEVWRSVAGLGVAASVAGAAFMFTQNNQYSDGQFSNDATQPIQTAEATQLFPTARTGSAGTSGGTSDFQLVVAGGSASTCF